MKSIWTMINQQYQICASYLSILLGQTSLEEFNLLLCNVLQ